jgi:hypothetical protein
MALILSGDTGPSFVQTAAMPTGSVLQTVNGTYTGQTNTSSTSFVDTGLTATITPTSTTSKILVLVSQIGLQKNGADIRVRIQLVRNGTAISQIESEALYTGTTAGSEMATSTSYLDSPASNAALTYKTQICIGSGTGTVYWCTVGGGSATGVATITLMEIHG